MLFPLVSIVLDPARLTLFDRLTDELAFKVDPEAIDTDPVPSAESLPTPIVPELIDVPPL
jgi:hypothetical protein